MRVRPGPMQPASLPGLLDGSVLTALRARLVSGAALFEDPRAYAAGVCDALDAVTKLVNGNGAVASGVSRESHD